MMPRAMAFAVCAASGMPRTWAVTMAPSFSSRRSLASWVGVLKPLVSRVMQAGLQPREGRARVCRKG